LLGEEKPVFWTELRNSWDLFICFRVVCLALAARKRKGATESDGAKNCGFFHLISSMILSDREALQLPSLLSAVL
jgi:hypothetical protein